jgi:hypothetical protein
MQCGGSGMFFPDPNFFIPDPGSMVEKIPDLHQLDMTFAFESQSHNDPDAILANFVCS